MIYLLICCLTVIIILDIKLLKSYSSDIDRSVLAFVFLVNAISFCVICAYLNRTPEQSYKRCTEIIPDKAEYCVKYLKE